MRNEFSADHPALLFCFNFLLATYSVAVRGINGIITRSLPGVHGFITTILLFCIPELDTFFALDAPQSFVQLSTHLLLVMFQATS